MNYDDIEEDDPIAPAPNECGPVDPYEVVWTFCPACGIEVDPKSRYCPQCNYCLKCD